MNRPADNRSCHPAPLLDAATGHVGEHMAALANAQTPSEALTALAALEAACREARKWIAVDLVLIDGWSYADAGRASGITRQAASKAYADAVNARMRRTITGRDDAVVIVARVPYHLRHAAVSLWLNAGVPATQVAEWAGHSVHVLLKVYASCIDGQDEAARKRIEAALGAPDSAENA
ncbi:hypothetical protein [Micromonospora sp. LA-10]|uniref:hypothetical protein n=1 Tax=Micromonospora sp. LA-10 TaxID=3446364 RepID=UPI003F725BF8